MLVRSKNRPLRSESIETTQKHGVVRTITGWSVSIVTLNDQVTGRADICVQTGFDTEVFSRLVITGSNIDCHAAPDATDTTCEIRHVGSSIAIIIGGDCCEPVGTGEVVANLGGL